MAKKSIELNNLQDKFTIINEDIKKISKKFPANSFDAIVTNPPYKKKNTGLQSNDKGQLISRHEVMCNLDDIVKASANLLNSNCSIYMVHRPNRLIDVIETLKRYKLEPKKIRFVYPKIGKEPNLILIKATKGGKDFLKIEKPLIIYNEDGSYTKEILKIYNKKCQEKKWSGKIYLVATPIGNLEDITLRAIKVLKEVDLIVAEDTRHTLKLLNYLEIKKPLTSYYKQNEKTKSNILINKILNGENIALVSDAGTPAISDPGEEIVKKAIENNIKIIPVPGACAAINALICSGINTKEFLFMGFLPVNKKEKKEKLEEVKMFKQTLIFYEAPHKLLNTLQDIQKIVGDRKIVLAREITKIHEEYIRGLISEVIKQLEEPKGEFVIIVEGNKYNSNTQEQELLNNLSLEEHYKYYEKQNYEKKEIIKKIAKDRKTNKNEIYQHFII